MNVILSSLNEKIVMSWQVIMLLYKWEMISIETVYYSEMQIKNDTLYLVVSDKGLVYIGSLNEPLEAIQKKLPQTFEWIKAKEKVDYYQALLEDYFKQSKRTIRCPINPWKEGTPFQEAVWEELKKIPYGQTRTYEEIAKGIGRPRSTRAVANAIGANPLRIVIPCHRVVRKDGSLGGYNGGVDMKKWLLSIEKNRLEEECQ